MKSERIALVVCHQKDKEKLEKVFRLHNLIMQRPWPSPDVITGLIIEQFPTFSQMEIVNFLRVILETMHNREAIDKDIKQVASLHNN